MPDGTSPLIAGRSCPPHYGYSPRVFARAAELAEETVYVVGGLYGNTFALDTIERLSEHEPVPPRLVFNGDFHWFDAEPAWFAEIERRVVEDRRHVALRGNVETEIANDDPSAGCGCAYPESVPDDNVERSNAILARLRDAAVSAAHRSRRELPMHLVVQVGEARIAIVHGDAWSLAGWRFAHDALHDPANEPLLAAAFEQAAVDGFACSHTCAPALKRVANRFVINNGAAGMANFKGTRYGVMTRISTRAAADAIAHSRVYGIEVAGVFIDALAIDFAFDAWLRRFDALWAAGSPAAVSYRRRIVDGPDFSIAHALGNAMSTVACAA